MGFSSVYVCPLEVSESCKRWVDLDALKLEKNDFEGSLVCLAGSFGEGGYWGMAVMPGVGGGWILFGCAGVSVVVELAVDFSVVDTMDLAVTGRMVDPLMYGDTGVENGDFGVSGLKVSGLKVEGLWVSVLLKLDCPKRREGALADFFAILVGLCEQAVTAYVLFEAYLFKPFCASRYVDEKEESEKGA